MNKKILIGSIIAVAVLIGVSFTGVVGHQTTKSSTIATASPLFTVRSRRAIDKESQGFTCDFVGKGEEITISVPVRNNIEVLLEKIKDTISKIDSEEFNRFKNLNIDELRNINALKEIDINNCVVEQLITDLSNHQISDLTTDFPILCLLENVIFNFILYFIYFPLLLLGILITILISGDLPPTLQYPPTLMPCCA